MDTVDNFAEIYPRLRAFAAVVGPVEDEPDDLVQEAVEKMLRRRARTEILNPEAYLRQTIVNLASNRRRSLGRRRRARSRMRAKGYVADTYPSDVHDLMALPVEVRAVMWMVDVEGAPFSEAAAALGCSEDAARARASRGRARLRSELTAEELA